MPEKLHDLLREWQYAGDSSVKTAVRGIVQRYLGQQSLDILQREIATLSSLRQCRMVLGCYPKGVLYDYVQMRLLQIKYGSPMLAIPEPPDALDEALR